MHPTTPSALGRLGRTTFALSLLLATGTAGFFVYRFQATRPPGVPKGLVVHEASLGAFDHIVKEQGDVESSSNVEVLCEVEARYPGTQILWVVAEGERVKKGDKLVVLDSSTLEERQKEYRLRVLRAESIYKAAEAAHVQAEIAKQEYIEGTYTKQRSAILSLLATAEESLRKAEMACRSTEALVEKGLVTPLQLQGDQFAVKNAANRVEQEQHKLRVLENLTKERMLVRYDSSIESTAARLTAMQRYLMQERKLLAEIEEQITKCVIYAPSDGIVVHANRYSSRGGSAEFIVEAGAYVRERQTIVRLPDPTQMQVKCKVNESQVNMLAAGMPVLVEIDALPGSRLRGRVSKVNAYAEPNGWGSSAKEYAMLVELVDVPEALRTGMTADVKVFVEQIPEALQIPVQGIYEHGGELYTLIQSGPESFETRKLGVHAISDTMASITDGLRPGERVVLNLRQHLDLMQLPEVGPEDHSDLQELALGRIGTVATVPAGEPVPSRRLASTESLQEGEGG